MHEETQFYLDEINIRSILRDFLKNWWLFILAALTAVLLISSYENLVYKEQFTSKATMVVSAKGKGTSDAFADLTTTTGMADVFSDIFSSNVLRKLVAEELDVKTSSFSINANIIPETNLLIVQVTGEDPRIVHLAIGEVLEHCTEVSEYVFSNAVLDILQSPTVVASSSGFSASRYRNLAIIGAFVLMAGIIGVLSVFRNTVKTEAAARRRLQGKKLALIGHEEKNRTLKSKIKSLTKAILITNPTTSFGYLEAFQKLSFRVKSDMKMKDQKVLLVTSIGENEGKSTVASNIALSLSQNGNNVVLADLDLRRSAIYKIFDLSAKKYNGLWEENINQRLKLILNRDPDKKTVEYLKRSGIRELIAEERKSADYIIIDSSPVNVAADTELILSQVDAVLFVIRQDWTQITEINRFIDVISKSNKEFLGYVLNDFENRNPIGRKQYNYGYGKHYKKYGEYSK
jgi:capsular exopolysaccharide synthesis family protein